MNFLPKDEKFFELFKQHAQILCDASRLLISGLESGYSGVCGIADRMAALEDAGDHVIHDIFARLRSTFITPFDPEDIQALATTIDDVLDGIDEVTFRIVAYRLDPIPAAVLQIAVMVDSSCVLLSRALEALHQKKSVIEICIEINRLENDADKVERAMLTELFRHETDPIALIRQKEIYEALEATTDSCEDVADVIQNVAVKNS
jgi:hypothetical protein